jgi:hypothetical protein
LCQRLGQPASLLNLAANLMAVDCGGNEVTVFAGPVFSHYEFELGPATRMTDAEWKTRIKSGSVPAEGYLAAEFGIRHSGFGIRHSAFGI